MNYKTRQIQGEMKELSQRERGRLMVLTGARQTGKSTLAAQLHPEWDSLSMDSPVEREVYLGYSPAQWIRQYPLLVVDEVQKAPDLFDTLKACYDRSPEQRMLLLGSSQVLLMKGVRESLAGRAVIRELYPFSLTETMGQGDTASYLETLLRAPEQLAERLKLLAPDLVVKEEYAEAEEAWIKLLRVGGLPKVHQQGWGEEDAEEWLKDYCLAYLQRDLGDLARLDRLEPFVRCQRVAALRTAQCINFSDLARAADVSPPTAKQFIHYLELSYQVSLLPAWFRNQEKRLTKMPKLHFLDSGVRRAIAQQSGAPSGAEFESLVHAEVLKVVRNARLPWKLHHLRTADGREVDLLLEHEKGYVALECKQTRRVSSSDFRHFRGLGEILDKPILAVLVLSNMPQIQSVDLGESLPAFALPASLCFQPFHD